MGRIRIDRRLLIVAVAALWVGGLAVYPLLESTEGRYASVAWDMAHGGSWIEPHFNGHHLFTKPPLAYWSGALALDLLPDAEWAVRLPATLMLLACAALTRLLAVAAGLDRRRALWAGLMALLSPLAIVQGHMTTGDIFLWTGILLSYLALLDTGRRRGVRALLLGLGLAVGFMAKGHMVLFWVVIPLLAWAATTRGVRTRPALLVHPLALLVFVGLAAPWFVAAMRRHPELLDFWLKKETADRVLTSTHGRTEPWWYFLPQLPLLALPWLPELWRAVRRGAAASAAGLRAADRRLWLTWVAVPFVLLSIVHSKRPNYLLPMVTPLALLAAAALPAEAGPWLRRRMTAWTCLVLVLPFAVGLAGLGPQTRAIVRRLDATGRSWATFHADPSSLEFYHHGVVPGTPHEDALGDDGSGPRDPAPGSVLDDGGLLLTTGRHLGEVEAEVDDAALDVEAVGRYDIVSEKPAAGSPAPQ